MEEEYPQEKWWTEDQLSVVNDRLRVWTHREFVPCAGFWIRRDGKWLLGKVSQHDVLPEDGKVEENAWDHEHCYLCGDSISQHVGHESDGYTDGNDWLCVPCHERYILPRVAAT
jgi:hypothetical protein